ncbi:TetR/AcrR family transcriptional regulator (plasmid) [Gemmobacter fulvus]|uniref:TetR/AcrR family transcriptional regulator n=1 Tax=Gemmobacter fulvus TaxID=2840474 RepID=A0A975PCZ7_9RHOB|nr:TetR/AcrR family transcriptional regulator [Gemmobacter fulvus]MBT9247694.1 TetR/AcrR family transcriptional regulator [Gemmobacter fulvus]QWK92876.1 TetR/AcrR family transcriptional regulator [Gemmobacter fulvus]
MRVTRAQAEQNHQAVINAASTLFREHGFDGIGLKDLMKGAGLTQGGFYKQFASKEDLIAQASGRSMEMAAQRWTDAVAKNPDAPLEAITAFYLSPEHLNEKSKGCPMVALGADAARQGPKVKARFEAGVKEHLRMLSDLTGSDGDGGPSDKAMVLLSLMVGALTLSRAVNDEALAHVLLQAVASQVRDIAAD